MCAKNANTVLEFHPINPIYEAHVIYAGTNPVS
jgi:hypothetical protein